MIMLTGLALLLAGCQSPTKPLSEIPELQKTHVSGVVPIDDLYPSMFGPTNDVLDIKLEEGPPELAWVTGFEANIVGEDPSLPKSQEFNCHNTLSFRNSLPKQRAFFGAPILHGSNRMFTISQGQNKVEFPEGFGMPILTSQDLVLQSQVLNLREDFIGEKVRHAVKIDYKKESEAKGQFKPLMLIEFGIAVELSDYTAVPLENAKKLQPGCNVNAGGVPKMIYGGKKVTSHWIIPPGRDERTTEIFAPFPFDSRIHYFAVHVHPYLERFELWDLEEKKKLFAIRAEQAKENPTELVDLQSFSSTAGVPVYAGRNYLIKSVYNNVSDQPITAMAFAFCYVEDKQFKIPDTTRIENLATDQFCNGE